MLADLPPMQTSLEVTKLEPGTSYEFRVMSKGQPEAVSTPQRSYRRISSAYPEFTPAVLSKPTLSGPHALPKEFRELHGVN